LYDTNLSYLSSTASTRYELVDVVQQPNDITTTTMTTSHVPITVYPIRNSVVSCFHEEEERVVVGSQRLGGLLQGENHDLSSFDPTTEGPIPTSSIDTFPSHDTEISPMKRSFRIVQNQIQRTSPSRHNDRASHPDYYTMNQSSVATAPSWNINLCQVHHDTYHQLYERTSRDVQVNGANSLCAHMKMLESPPVSSTSSSASYSTTEENNDIYDNGDEQYVVPLPATLFPTTTFPIDDDHEEDDEENECRRIHPNQWDTSRDHDEEVEDDHQEHHGTVAQHGGLHSTTDQLHTNRGNILSDHDYRYYRPYRLDAQNVSNQSIPYSQNYKTNGSYSGNDYPNERINIASTTRMSKVDNGPARLMMMDKNFTSTVGIHEWSPPFIRTKIPFGYMNHDNTKRYHTSNWTPPSSQLSKITNDSGEKSNVNGSTRHVSNEAVSPTVLHLGYDTTVSYGETSNNSSTKVLEEEGNDVKRDSDKGVSHLSIESPQTIVLADDDTTHGDSKSCCDTEVRDDNVGHNERCDTEHDTTDNYGKSCGNDNTGVAVDVDGEKCCNSEQDNGFTKRKSCYDESAVDHETTCESERDTIHTKKSKRG
jgi:hypothetical protein